MKRCPECGRPIDDDHYNSYSDATRYEIVFTEHLYDAGLCIEKGLRGKPRRVLARHNLYGPGHEYGGVEILNWIHSGKYVTKHAWNTRTNQHMSACDVALEFGINPRRLKDGIQ